MLSYVTIPSFLPFFLPSWVGGVRRLISIGSKHEEAHTYGSVVISNSSISRTQLFWEREEKKDIFLLSIKYHSPHKYFYYLGLLYLLLRYYSNKGSGSWSCKTISNKRGGRGSDDHHDHRRHIRRANAEKG